MHIDSLYPTVTVSECHRALYRVICGGRWYMGVGGELKRVELGSSVALIRVAA